MLRDSVISEQSFLTHTTKPAPNMNSILDSLDKVTNQLLMLNLALPCPPPSEPNSPRKLVVMFKS